MVTPAAERKAVARLVADHGMSERRACKAIGCCRMTVRYQTTRPDDGNLRERMKAIAHERRRFGYRRLHVMLRREGFVVNHKRLFRLYCEERLKVRRRGGRKRAMGTRRPIETPLAPNQRWSLDFVSDQLTDGRRFRILAVVDDCTRECLALVADSSLSGLRVARELDAIIRQRGKRPDTIVSDNGTEYTSNAILQWADSTGIGWHYIAPGKPQQNGFIERLASPAFGSTAACETSCSTKPCSDRWPMPDPPWKPGGVTTTPRGHTRSWAGRRQPPTHLPSARDVIWRSATPKAPRQIPSLPSL